MTPVAAIVAVSCWVAPPASAFDLDRIVSVLHGEAVAPPAARSDEAATILAARRVRP